MGLAELELLTPAPLDLDVHDIPPLRADPAHAHFDVRFLFRASSLAFQAGSDAKAARWVPLDQIDLELSDRSVLRAVAGEGPGAESSVAKLVGVRSRQESAALVVALLGDRVVLGDDDARAAVHEQLLTRCLSIAGGTTQVLRNVAAERILGLPRG